MRKSFSGIILTLLILTSTLTLAFNIQPVKADDGTIYIRADGSIDPPTAPIQRSDEIYTFTGNIYNYSVMVQRGNIIVDGNGYVLQGAGSGNGIFWSDINNVTIRNMQIKNFECGIKIRNSRNNNIYRNDITNNLYHGISIWESSYNSIHENSIINNSYQGIELNSHSDCNIIYRNNIKNNGGCGIKLDWCCNNNNIYENNIAENNGSGIDIYQFSNFNKIYGNNIYGNNKYSGIGLGDNCNYNDIYENYIVENKWSGISLVWSANNSIYRNHIIKNAIVGNKCVANSSAGIALYNSADNSIYNNNFIDNCIQVLSFKSVNHWDIGYQFGGNYWSDYIDVDQYSGPSQDQPGSDGIWDHPYVINENNIDHYPLVNPWTQTPSIQTWLFDSNFQYNLDDNYGTAEGTGHLTGKATLSTGALTVEGQITINGPLPSAIPEVYLVATDGPDKELAKQSVDISRFSYWQIGPNTYNFTGQIPNVIQPINDGHYEVEAIITYKGAKYEFFINTASLIDSHYQPLMTPSLKFVVVPAEGWQNKELFVPVWCRSVEDPGKIVLGIYNKRNMWYLVKVYKKMPDGTWLEIVPDEFLREGPYVGPWSEKTFLYTPQAGDEIKIEVLNDKTDFGLMSLWTLDFVMRTLVGLRLPAKLPDYTDWNVFKEHLKDFYNAVIKPILSDIRSGLWKEVLKEVCQKVLEIRGAFSAIVVGLGFPTSLEDKIWAKIGEMAGGLLLIISIVDNVVSTRAWELFENLFKSPFSEDVTFMIASKAPAAPKVEVSSGVAIIQSEPYYIGETINARFRITNKGSETITLHVLTIGGRGPEGDVQDFTFKTNIVINPGEAYDYEGELTLLNTGSYHFFVAYQTVDGVWVTNVPASAGAVNSLDINVLSPNSWVAAELCSPGELRIYDSQDRVTGLVNNEELRRIPYSFYFEGIVVIYDPNDSYKYQVKGTNEGEYNITLARCIFENLTVFEAEQIPISNNSLHQYTCNWDTLSLNAEGVTVQVDSDGDGFFEKTFVSDSKLTYKEFMFPTKATFTFNALWEGVNYPIIVSSSNSTIADFNFYQSLKQISFKVSGETGTSGYCNVTIPKNLLKGEPWTVRLNGTDWTFTATQNETHSFLYFTYTHSSTYEVTIQGTWAIPEFPSTTILLTFVLNTLTAIILLRKKRKAKSCIKL